MMTCGEGKLSKETRGSGMRYLEASSLETRSLPGCRMVIKGLCLQEPYPALGLVRREKGHPLVVKDVRRSGLHLDMDRGRVHDIVKAGLRIRVRCRVRGSSQKWGRVGRRSRRGSCGAIRAVVATMSLSLETTTRSCLTSTT